MKHARPKSQISTTYVTFNSIEFDHMSALNRIMHTSHYPCNAHFLISAHKDLYMAVSAPWEYFYILKNQLAVQWG